MGLVAVLASQNPHKLAELRSALPEWQLDLVDPLDFPPETGTSYYENACAKARYGRRVAPAEAWVLGEDSGIEVEALGGRPGIESARWAKDPIAALLAELASVANRRARYVCELVGLAPGGEELRGTGVLEGSVVEVPRGTEGFGYDPVFVPAGHIRTVAELGNSWKSKNSHRARAAAQLANAVSAVADG